MAKHAVALADILPLDAEAFKTRRTGGGRKPIELAPDILAKVREIVTANGGLMGSQFFTATSADTDAYNDKRASDAKSRNAEAPERISKAGNAERLARADASKWAPYVNAVADELEKAVSLRVRNEGNEDKPNCRWAFVLVNHRERKPKAEATATATA